MGTQRILHCKGKLSREDAAKLRELYGRMPELREMVAQMDDPCIEVTSSARGKGERVTAYEYAEGLDGWGDLDDLSEVCHV